MLQNASGLKVGTGHTMPELHSLSPSSYALLPAAQLAAQQQTQRAT